MFELNGVAGSDEDVSAADSPQRRGHHRVRGIERGGDVLVQSVLRAACYTEAANV